MPEPRHLSNAPITEALFDIRVKARPDFDVGRFQDLKGILVSRFPVVEEKRGGQFTFQFAPRADSHAMVEDLGIQGYFFRSPSDQLLAQFRVDGFTLNKLKPYTDWDHLFPVAIELWRMYIETARPQAVIRQALRYINHIRPPGDYIDFDEYLRAAPRLPPELPQTLAAFFSRVTVVDPELLVAAHIAQAFDPKTARDGVTIIIDIDCFKNVDILPEDEDTLIANFSDLRQFKNRVFFNYVTDRTLEMYE